METSKTSDAIRHTTNDAMKITVCMSPGVSNWQRLEY